MNWKRFSDEQPPLYTPVYTVTTGGEVCITHFADEHYSADYTHWMPITLPEPPPKPDPCREAWRKYAQSWGHDAASLDDFRAGWDACAKRYGYTEDLP